MNLREDTIHYKFTGETSNRLWGKFISHQLSASLSQAWKANHSQSFLSIKKKPPTIKRPPRPQAKTYQHLLTIPQRHRQIQFLLFQLSLSPSHRQSLQALVSQ